MDRIVIIGSSCSGKSTLAIQLSEKIKYQYIELDELAWLPNWKLRKDDEFRSLVSAEIKSEQWVVAGNFSVVRDILWPRSTTIIWLNHSFHIVLYRCLTRTINRVFSKKKLFSGNIETFKQSFFSHDSIILFVLKTYHHKRRNYRQLLENQRAIGKQTIELKNQEQVNSFLDGLLL